MERQAIAVGLSRVLPKPKLRKSLSKLANKHLCRRSEPTPGHVSEQSFMKTLPFELREMIFNYCDLYNSWKPEFKSKGRRPAMPPLIIALRPLPIPYHHALAMFYRRNRYTIGDKNSHSFGWMLPSAISTIRNINIDVASFYLKPDALTKQKSSRLFRRKSSKNPDENFPLRPYRTTLPHLSTSLREVALLITRPEFVIKHALMQTYITDFPKFLAPFQDLKIAYVEVPCWSFVKDGKWVTDSGPTLRRYGRLIGCGHLKVFNAESEVQTWVYVARKGGSLDCRRWCLWWRRMLGDSLGMGNLCTF